MGTHVTENEIGTYRSHLVEPGFTEFSLDVILLREAKTPVGLQANVGCFPTSFRSEHFGHVRF